jgi:hypothetical protein
MNNAPISLVQISRALSLSPGTLSNWQKRYEGFPEPAAILGQRRLYRMDDIQAFMVRHDLKTGDANSVDTQKVSEEQRFVKYLTNELRGNHAMGPEIVLVIAATAFRVYPQLHEFKKDHGTPHSITDDLKLGAELLVRGAKNDANINLSDWKDAPASLNPVALALALRNLLEKISGRQYGGQYTTALTVAKLLAKIAMGLDVLDMCSGYGNLLSEYQGGSRRIVGQEINATVAAISRVLAFLEGYTVEIHNEDSIANFHPEWIRDGFDAIAIDPPMGMRLRDDQIDPNDLRWTFFPQSKTSQTDDFWIQSALAYLRSSSVEVPFRAALHLRSGWFFDGSEGPMRDALLKSGVVEAVIALGNGTSAGSGISTNILVLRKVGVVLNSVRMIDARDAGRVVGGQRSFTDEEINSIVAALRGQGEQNSKGEVKVLDVSLKEILDNGSVLTVNRYITDAQHVKTFDESIRFFESTVKSLKASMEQMGSSLKMVDSHPLVNVKNQTDIEFKMYSLSQTKSDNSPIISLFKNRPQSNEWTRDDIFPDDIVVSMVGSRVGEALMGSEVLERNLKWSKVWIIRTQSRVIDPLYIAVWAKYGGLEIQIRPLVSGTTVPMLSKRDLDRIQLPVPPDETQKVIALWGEMVTSMANVFNNLGETQNEFLISIRNIGTSFFGDLDSKGDKQ